MPPLIVAVLLGAGAYAGYRAARHIWQTLAEPSAPTQAPVEGESRAEALEKDLGSLEPDPVTGVYRPAGRN